MPNKPNKWISALLNMVAPPLGLLHAAQPWWALAYFLAAMSLAGLGLHSTKLQGVTGLVTGVLWVWGVVHAYFAARRYPHDKPRPAYSRWLGLACFAAGFVVFAVGLRSFFFEPFRAPSGSMLPTLVPKATLVVQKWGYGNYGTFGFRFFSAPVSSPLARGDLIVFEFPQDRSVHYVKRLVGLPGDQVAYRGKRLFINGQAVPLRRDGEYFDAESMGHTPRYVETLSGGAHWVLLADRPGPPLPGPAFPLAERCAYGPEEISCEVPAGHFFTLGDNRDNSSDSRYWGFVPASHLVGKVVFFGS